MFAAHDLAREQWWRHSHSGISDIITDVAVQSRRRVDPTSLSVSFRYGSAVDGAPDNRRANDAAHVVPLVSAALAI